MRRFNLGRACTRAWAALAVAAALPAGAQTPAPGYPSRPITLISFSVPGGSVDNASRAWGHCVAGDKRAGQPVVLLNRSGGNGVVAANAFRLAPADGQTLLLAGMSQTTIVPNIFKKKPFDPETEFQPAAMIGTATFVLVASAQSGITSIKELQAHAKASGKGIDQGIPGIATPAHLLSEALSVKLGFKSTLVPMNGEAGGVTALLGGQIPAMVFVTGSALPHIQSGKLVPLMAFTAQRIPELPKVPTVVEELNDPSLVRGGWIGISVRAGTAPQVVTAIEDWTRSCLEEPEFRQALNAALIAPRYLPHQEFATVIRDDTAFWKPWITRLNISNE